MGCLENLKLTRLKTLLTCLSAFSLLFFGSPVAAATLPIDVEELGLLQSVQTSTCAAIRAEGYKLEGKLNADVRAQLASLLKKVLPANVGAEASLYSSMWSGLSQEQVGALAQSAQECRQHVFNKWLDYKRDQRKLADVVKKVEATSQKTVRVKEGNSQSVTVTNSSSNVIISGNSGTIIHQPLAAAEKPSWRECLITHQADMNVAYDLSRTMQEGYLRENAANKALNLCMEKADPPRCDVCKEEVKNGAPRYDVETCKEYCRP